MNPPLLWIVWLINGLLAVLYTLLDNVLVLVLIPPMVWLAITAKREQRMWIAATGVVAAAIISAMFVRRMLDDLDLIAVLKVKE